MHVRRIAWLLLSGLLALTSLAGARSLLFGLRSSDVGPFGINTPTYIALDNLVVAAPTAVRAESEVGLPNGPSRSVRTGRPSRWTSSFRMPGYDSPATPRRSVTSPSIFPAS